MKPAELPGDVVERELEALRAAKPGAREDELRVEAEATAARRLLNRGGERGSLTINGGRAVALPRFGDKPRRGR